MEKIHLALDGLGFMPLFGSAFDGINAVIYVGEGKYGEAMLSGASVIPIVGLSAKVTKLGLKGTKYAQEALKLGGSSVGAAKTAEKLAADAVDAAKLEQEAKGAPIKTEQLIDGAKLPPEAFRRLSSVGTVAGIVRQARRAPSVANDQAFVCRALGGTLTAAKKAETAAPKAAVTTKPPEVPAVHKEVEISANPAKEKVEIEDPINAVTGSFSVQMTDLYLTDLGEDFLLKRSCESVYTNRRQHLGERWLLNLGKKLERKEEKITLLLEGHKKETFQKSGGRWEKQRTGDRSMLLTEEKNGCQSNSSNKRPYTTMTNAAGSSESAKQTATKKRSATKAPTSRKSGWPVEKKSGSTTNKTS